MKYRNIYKIGGLITAVLVFPCVWLYAISQWGFLIGITVGWIPAAIAALVVGLLWPLALLAIIALAIFLNIQNRQYQSSGTASITVQPITPVNVPVTVLQTDYSGAGNLTPQYPQTVGISNASGFANQIGGYGVTNHVWIGPKGWTGKGAIGADGNTGIDIYPVGGSASSGAHITITEVPACAGCMVDDAAPYFTAAMQQRNANPTLYSYPVNIPQGLEVTPISATLVTYTLPDANGFSTHGVVYYIPGNASGNNYGYGLYKEAKFVLPQGQSDLSNFLLQTFISREGLK